MTSSERGRGARADAWTPGPLYRLSRKRARWPASGHSRWHPTGRARTLARSRAGRQTSRRAPVKNKILSLGNTLPMRVFVPLQHAERLGSFRVELYRGAPARDQRSFTSFVHVGSDHVATLGGFEPGTYT